MNDFYQIILTLSILLFSFLFFFFLFVRNKKDIILVFLIFFWHTFFSIFYYWYSLFNTADATLYYKYSFSNNLEIYPGTKALIYLTSLFSKGLDASYLNTTLFYNFFGTFGIFLFYFSLKKYLNNLSWYWKLIIFIPSMSFWSAGLGKDAISFFSICLFLYTLSSNNKIYIFLPISFFIMFIVRPHIALMMIVSFVIYFIIRSKVHILFKLTILPIIMAGVILSSNFVQKYVGLDEASVDSISSYVDDRQNSNQGGGSSIDLQSMSYPVQIFTYVFRPLPFDAHSALALFTSIENTILLILFLYVLFKNNFRLNYFIEGKNTWLLIYAFLTCSMLAITTANLGIATRQKWMFMPILIYLLVYTFYQFKESQRIGRLRK
ncbi:hypothetical protein ACIRA0001_0532 [Acinetobacter radioresistens SK82]|uniref:Wzy n=1 Tax=Acinetobacter radioresistens SK82 TaxID=596318 RepID=A0ABM9YKP4_ACIRA|nr:hypothetical protein [Acinetobacter radioresistens]EET81500.1 hypothetical protein ACIRA0001_0532 [Acinetobacter radioresistens SK82]QMU04007.1 hypothetical protein FOC39_08040 [Acinetobacter radioresistens]